MTSWWLRGFDTENDELVVERQLPGFSVDAARSLLDDAETDPRAGSTPLTADQARRVAGVAAAHLDFAGPEYFLEYDANAPAEGRARAAGGARPPRG